MSNQTNQSTNPVLSRLLSLQAKAERGRTILAEMYAALAELGDAVASTSGDWKPTHKLIDATAILESYGIDPAYYGAKEQFLAETLELAPAVKAIPVDRIKAYLCELLDDWNALGDRKFDPANMQVYNSIRLMLDDLKREIGE